VCQWRFGCQPGLAGGGSRARPTARFAVRAENLSAFGGGTLPLTTNDIEIAQGVVMPAAYAMRAQRYLHDWGAAGGRPHQRVGQEPPQRRRKPAVRIFQKEVTLEDVDNSRPVADPLPAVALLPQQRRGGRRGARVRNGWPRLPGPHVRVAASVVRSGRFSTGYRDMTWPEHHRAGRRMRLCPIGFRS
jgi:hypothetical protein